VPAIAGQYVHLYVREKLPAGASDSFGGGAATGKVVLFVHGGTYPSAPDYDVAYKDYSWMDYLAGWGFDVFAMDITGYGQSTRPWPMEDPCNLTPELQTILIPTTLPATRTPSYPFTLDTSQSDWDDIDEVVNYVRGLRRVDRLSLVGWSAGGPRMGGYAGLHPEKVDKMVLLAPAYNRLTPFNPPAQVPAPGNPMTITTAQRAFHERWDPQVQCADRFDPGIRDVIWAMNMAFDPVGATWGPGVVRAPTRAPAWGWNPHLAARVQAPTLLVSGELDQEVNPQAVRDLYTDLGSQAKVFLAVPCSSHYLVYETRHTVLLHASLEWLSHGTFEGQSQGSFERG
jgi:pimeloyl-ACP methyl ester carboxylesterase